MKIIFKKQVEVEISTLQVSAGVRYWQDAEINGVEDELGQLVPFRNGEYWEPIIDIDKGIIIGWPVGTVADIHYKVCDDGTYTLKDQAGVEILKKEGYVPYCMSSEEEGYGDYIIFNVDENGFIRGWKPKFSDFLYD